MSIKSDDNMNNHKRKIERPGFVDDSKDEFKGKIQKPKAPEKLTRSGQRLKKRLKKVNYVLVFGVIVVLVIVGLVAKLTIDSIHRLNEPPKALDDRNASEKKFEKEYSRLTIKDGADINQSYTSKDLGDLKQSYSSMRENERKEHKDDYEILVDEFKIQDDYNSFFVDDNSNDKQIKKNVRPTQVLSMNGKYKQRLYDMKSLQLENEFSIRMLKNMSILGDDANKILNAYQFTDKMFKGQLTNKETKSSEKHKQKTLSLAGDVTTKDMGSHLEELESLNYNWHSQTKKVEELIKKAIPVAEKRESSIASSKAKSESEEESKRSESRSKAESESRDRDSEEASRREESIRNSKPATEPSTSSIQSKDDDTSDTEDSDVDDSDVDDNREPNQSSSSDESSSESSKESSVSVGIQHSDNE